MSYVHIHSFQILQKFVEITRDFPGLHKNPFPSHPPNPSTVGFSWGSELDRYEANLNKQAEWIVIGRLCRSEEFNDALNYNFVSG